MPETSENAFVTAQLDRIVNGPPLASSPSLCRFLRYVVEETLNGRSGSLKEYSLGVVVFDRGDEFDPRLDPIVRVQARNLRVRLGQYYAGPGAGDPVVIELPKRTYVPVFHFRQQVVEEPAVESVQAGGGLTAGARADGYNADSTSGGVENAPPGMDDRGESGCTPTPESVPVAGHESDVARVEALASIDPAVEQPVALGEPGIRPEAPSAARRGWPAPGWALSGAGVVLVMVAAAALWHARPAQSAHKSAHDPDPVAQDLYIRGRYLADRETEPSLRESIDAYSQAVKRDPQFAPAYAGMADAYNVLAQFGYMPPKEAMEQARRAAERALDIDPALAEAHVSLAAIIEAYDWNWTAAEREYRRAIELNPALPSAHLWYGMFLRDQGRLQEALPELRRAAQLEPFSVLTAINLANAYMMAGNYAAAEEQAQHAASQSPDMVTAEVLLSNTYQVQSRTAEADAALERAEQFSAGNPHAIAVLACAYVRHGHRDEAVRLSQQLDSLSKQRYVSPFDLGSVSLVLGDEKRALDLMEEAYRQRSSGLIFLRSVKFEDVHRSPGFDSLIQKMHFAS